MKWRLITFDYCQICDGIADFKAVDGATEWIGYICIDCAREHGPLGTIDKARVAQEVKRKELDFGEGD